MRSLQSDVEQRGTRIFELVDKHPERLFSKAGFYQRLMALSMHDERFKTQLFRFVAVLPSLRRSSEIIQHLEEYFSDSNDGFPPLVGMGVRVARLVPWISAPVLRWNVSEMARQFIAGRNPHEVIATLRKRRAQKIGFTVDVLGEAVVSEAEADEYAAIYGDLLEKLARETREWTDPLGKNAELFPVVNLSVKISALYSQMSPAAPADAIAHLSTKLRPLLRRARELGAFINFDMESYALKNTTLELFKTILTEAEFKDWPHAGIVIQAYLRDSEGDLRDLIEWGRARGTRFAVRLVKGAYWDYETTKSGQNGSNPPVFLQKPESDANFEKLTRVLFENESVVTPAFGSHNVRSIAHAQAVADELGELSGLRVVAVHERLGEEAPCALRGVERPLDGLRVTAQRDVDRVNLRILEQCLVGAVRPFDLPLPRIGIGPAPIAACHGDQVDLRGRVRAGDHQSVDVGGRDDPESHHSHDPSVIERRAVSRMWGLRSASSILQVP